MKFDLMTSGLPLRQMQQLAVDAERAGFSGLVVTEAGRTAYLGCAVAAVAADIDLLTGIAVAFPRSPMVTAQAAWELAEASRGRFRLGIGAQVRTHVERRYGAEFDQPGPRLRDYVLALRAIFSAFRGESPLQYDGPFWKLSMLPAMWSPGPIEVPNPPIDVAAVNPWMMRMAGEVADGVHVHPLNTPTYLRTTVQPNLKAGAARREAHLGPFEVIVPTFVAPGTTSDDVHEWREMARMQVAFYGSTPNYSFIFDQLGRKDTTSRIRERQKAGDIASMAAIIDDELLDHFCISGDWAPWRTVLSIATRVWQPDWSLTLPGLPGPVLLKHWARGVNWREPSAMRLSLSTLHSIHLVVFQVGSRFRHFVSVPTPAPARCTATIST